MQRLMYTMVVAVSVSIVGCGSDGRSGETPPVSYAEDEMSDVIESHSHGFMELTEFEKVNGQKSTVDGVEKYTMDYRGTVSVVNECFWSFDRGVRTIPVGMVYKIRRTRTFGGMPSPDSQEISSFAPALVGDEIEVAGSIHFEKFEKGWQPTETEGFKISSADNEDVTNNTEDVFDEKPSDNKAEQYADEVRSRASELSGLLNEGDVDGFFEAVDPTLIRVLEQRGALEKMKEGLAAEGSPPRESVMTALQGVSESEDIEFFKGGDVAVVYPNSSGFVGEQEPQVFIRRDGAWYYST